MVSPWIVRLLGGTTMAVGLSFLMERPAEPAAFVQEEPQPFCCSACLRGGAWNCCHFVHRMPGDAQCWPEPDGCICEMSCSGDCCGWGCPI